MTRTSALTATVREDIATLTVAGSRVMDIEEIAAIAVEEYDAGAFMPEMAERLAAKTLISKRESVMLIAATFSSLCLHSLL